MIRRMLGMFALVVFGIVCAGMAGNTGYQSISEVSSRD